MIPDSAFEYMTEEGLLARLGWGEARGEGPVGMLAVMWVALNRSRRRKRALKDVILQPFQFSAFNKGDPNRSSMLSADVIEPVAWGEAQAIAQLMLAGYTRDPTGGASHYYSMGIPTPTWAQGPGWTELTAIGRHVFGRTA